MRIAPFLMWLYKVITRWTHFINAVIRSNLTRKEFDYNGRIYGNQMVSV